MQAIMIPMDESAEQEPLLVECTYCGDMEAISAPHVEMMLSLRCRRCGKVFLHANPPRLAERRLRPALNQQTPVGECFEQ